MARGDQHPFTPEPREPEPWPRREITPWEWAGGEANYEGHQSTHLVADEDLLTLWHAEAEEADRYRQRGFSVGFGAYTGEDPWADDETS